MEEIADAGGGLAGHVEPSLEIVRRDHDRRALVDRGQARARGGGQDRDRVDLAAVRGEKGFVQASERGDLAGSQAHKEGLRLSGARPAPFVEGRGGHEAAPVAQRATKGLALGGGLRAGVEEEGQVRGILGPAGDQSPAREAGLAPVSAATGMERHMQHRLRRGDVEARRKRVHRHEIESRRHRLG
ncbi:hypothetical protein SAMN05216566_101193 [Aureimonas phyllosphaerae]|uniref:Uncharacterized protein n=1 Tax=Aureimonas phyllosphaerae TaxID=1166078 RepID=A0A7W6FT29_9HYPH|nr:hypothetical protein [Aureimonas phyllosphaerae]MBB3958223.1 hypothetical protein [Aureimonas phyllosphaerae]SFE93833.1 hypothetical protein SAMN05216566_101193 [Aureimonas phyllosphaerae]